MRRARKTDPTLTAEFRAKRGSVSQIPADSLAGNFDPPAAFVLTNPVLANRQEKRTCTAPAQTRAARTKTLQRKSLDQRLRSPLSRKPRCPDLQGLPLRIARASAPARIHQQISEPPSPAPIAQSEPQKPNLVSPSHRQS